MKGPWMSPRGGVNRHSKISAKLTLESTVSTQTGKTGQVTGQTGCTDLTAETKKAIGQTGPVQNLPEIRVSALFCSSTNVTWCSVFVDNVKYISSPYTHKNNTIK